MATRRHRTREQIGRAHSPGGRKAAPGSRDAKSSGDAHRAKPKADNRKGSSETGSTAQRIRSTALKILAGRSRSETELRERLLSRFGEHAKLVEDCVSTLKEMGYVNDRRFAQSYATHRLSSKPVGRARLARELASRKVDRDAIDEALSVFFHDTAEDELIDRAIRKRIRTAGRPVDRGSARRLFNHLARLGFEYDLIVRKLRALRTGFDEETVG